MLVPKGDNCNFARQAVLKPGIGLWLNASFGLRGRQPRAPTDVEIPELSSISWGHGCEELIEPLTGHGRHPLASPWPCNMRTALQQAGNRYHPKWAVGRPAEKYATDYLLVANRCAGAESALCRPAHPKAGTWRHNHSSLAASRSRNLFFDLGCAAFGKMLSGEAHFSPVGYGPSIPIFYEMFRRNCIEFDAIWAWEARQYTPDVWWKHVPPDMRRKLTFYNEPVNPSNSSFLGVLEATARVKDFVVVKLDIDTPWLEHKILQDIIDKPHLAALVDELFFEFHFQVDDSKPPPAHKRAAEDRPDIGVRAALQIMQRLRHLGIRAHFWV